MECDTNHYNGTKMNRCMKRLAWVWLCVLPATATVAQTTVAAGGGTVAGGGRTMTWSVGQTAVTTAAAGGGILTEGAVQPCRVESAGVGAAGEEQVEVYPNPTMAKVTLKRSAEARPTHLTLYAADGRLLLAREWADTATQLDLVSLPAGVYMLKINQSVYKITKR